jgi:hypothetical protein
MTQSRGRGPGRPSQGKIHIDLTLSKQVVQALKAMPAGERSKFVEEVLLSHPHIQRLMQQQESSDVNRESL